jgi:hypothetical protein
VPVTSSHANVIVGPSGIHGLGVFTTCRIAKGDTVLVIVDSRIVDAQRNTYVRWIGEQRHVVARRALEQGDEITYDYLIDCDGGQPWQCCCGSIRCLREIPASVFDLPADALCDRLPYLSDWFVAEHAARIEHARRRCRPRIDSQ